MTEDEGRLNLIEQVLDKVMLVIATTATPEQLEMLQQINDNWNRELKALDSAQSRRNHPDN